MLVTLFIMLVTLFIIFASILNTSAQPGAI